MAAVAAVAAAGAIALGGCGGGSSSRPAVVDHQALTRDLARRLRAQTGTSVDQVACPADVRLRRGATFRCSAAFDGEPGLAVVRLTSARPPIGTYTARLENLLLGRLEQAIERQFRRRGIRLSADCPGPQPQRAGVSFRCHAELSDGTRATVAVREQDDRGNVRLKLIR